MVFQNYALFPHMTVGENVAYPLKVRGVPQSRRDDLVREILEVVSLQGICHAGRINCHVAGNSA